MKKRIQDLIDIIKTGFYDQEDIHAQYDSLLEFYIRNINQYREEEYKLMCELIGLPKDFWYA